MPTKRKRVTVNLLPADDTWLARRGATSGKGLSDALQALIAAKRSAETRRASLEHDRQARSAQLDLFATSVLVSHWSKC